MREKAVPEEKIPVALPEKSELPPARGTCYHEYMINTPNLFLLSIILTSSVCHLESEVLNDAC